MIELNMVQLINRDTMDYVDSDRDYAKNGSKNRKSVTYVLLCGTRKLLTDIFHTKHCDRFPNWS